MAADEPFLTRWSFQDFESVYDDKFGRKHAPNADVTDNGHVASSNGAPPVANGGSSSSNGANGHVKNTSDMAIYEQYRNQGSSTALTNGYANGIAERP